MAYLKKLMPSNNKLFPQSEREREKREHGQKRDFEISKAKYF